jgi:hypothetical protein
MSARAGDGAHVEGARANVAHMAARAGDFVGRYDGRVSQEAHVRARRGRRFPRAGIAPAERSSGGGARDGIGCARSMGALTALQRPRAGRLGRTGRADQPQGSRAGRAGQPRSGRAGTTKGKASGRTSARSVARPGAARAPQARGQARGAGWPHGHLRRGPPSSTPPLRLPHASAPPPAPPHLRPLPRTSAPSPAPPPPAPHLRLPRVSPSSPLAVKGLPPGAGCACLPSHHSP